MALRYDDPECGFYHVEVVDFINNEIKQNRGDLNFYQSYQNHSWESIEKQLQDILNETLIARCHKRACTWSTLALAVRIIQRQQQQHEDQVEELLEKIWEKSKEIGNMASELYRIRQEKNQAAAEIISNQRKMEQVMDENESFRQRLLQIERYTHPQVCFQDVQPEKPTGEQCKAAAEDEQLQVPVKSKGQQTHTHLRVQMPAPDTLPSASGALGPLPVKVHPKYPRRLLPLHVPSPRVAGPRVSGPVHRGSKPTEAARSTGRPQVPRARIYSLQARQRLSDSPEKKRTSAGKIGLSGLEEYKVTAQSIDTSSESTQKSGVMPRKTSDLKTKTSHSIKYQLVMPQGMAAQGSRAYKGLRDYSQPLPRITPQVDNAKQDLRKFSGIAQSQNDPIMPQGTDVLEAGRIKSQKPGPSGTQESPLGKTKVDYMNKHTETEPLTKVKVKQPHAVGRQYTATTSKTASGTWIYCSSCKSVNAAWHKTCYKCKNTLFK